MPEWATVLLNILGGSAVGGVVWLFREVQKMQTVLALHNQRIKTAETALAKNQDIPERVKTLENSMQLLTGGVARIEKIVRSIQFALVGNKPYDPADDEQ